MIIFKWAGESQAWEYVIKWGLAQNPELPSDPKSFSKENFNSLKNTLQQCIRFINFYNFTSKEFFNSVFPYKKILPKESREELLSHFLNPDIKKLDSKETKEVKPEVQIIEKVDSNIITIQHAELISKWIGELKITDNVMNSYEYTCRPY